MPRHLLSIVVSFLVFVPTGAHALVLCGKALRGSGVVKEGSPVRVRTECKSSEIELDPDEFGLQGPAGSDGSSGSPGLDGIDGLSCWDANESFTCDASEDVALPAGCGVEDCGPMAASDTLQLVDANGSLIGTIVGMPDLLSGTVTALHRTPGGVIVPLVATELHLGGTGDGFPNMEISFEDPNCQGRAWADPERLTSGPGFHTLTLRWESNLYYVADPTTFEIAFRSSWRILGSGTCTNGVGSVGDQYELGVLDLSQFVIPFSVTGAP